MKRFRSAADDSGSVSVFIVGYFLLALLLVATTTDLAVLQLDRRTLQAQADGAALAAAQAPNLTAIYSSGLSSYVPIAASGSIGKARGIPHRGRHHRRAHRIRPPVGSHKTAVLAPVWHINPRRCPSARHNGCRLSKPPRVEPWHVNPADSRTPGRRPTGA